jgi:uncharacterized protein YjgD (DUF1641 family)
MAKPVAYRVFEPPPVDETALTRHIENLPLEHAEAVESAYKLLQVAQDSGTLDLLRGMMAAGDTIVEHVADAVSAKETVTAMRNLMLLGKVLGNLDPQLLQGALGGAPPDGAPTSNKAPSMFALVRKMSAEDTRRGLALALDLLAAVGHGLAKNGEAK